MRSGPRKILAAAFLALLSVLAPGCPTNKNLQPPVIIAGIPDSLHASNVALMPNIVVQFDRAMDPNFLGANYFFLIPNGSTSSVALTTEYLPALNEVRVIPSQFLVTDPPVTGYTLIISGLVQSAKGSALGSNQGFTFTTKSTNAATNLIAFSPASIVASNGPSAGQITLTWNKATEQQGAAVADITTYDVYMSSVQGGEDLIPGVFLPGNFDSVSGTGNITVTGLTSGTTYYFKVQPRDGDGNIYPNLPEISWVAP